MTRDYWPARLLGKSAAKGTTTTALTTAGIARYMGVRGNGVLVVVVVVVLHTQ